jgi:dolichol-phosphate mannosyltransferase
MDNLLVRDNFTGDIEITLVVPVFNEEDNIVPFVKEVSDRVRIPHHICIIYDRTDDTTLRKKAEVLAIEPNVSFIQTKGDAGIINALKTGFEISQTRYIVVIMADLSDTPETINALYARIQEGYDLVVASRYCEGGNKIGGPRIKKWLSRFANHSLHYLTRIPTHDMTNAYIIHKKKIIEQINIRSTGGFEVTMEIIAKTFILGYKISEVPTINRERYTGTSKFRIAKWLMKYIYWYFYVVFYSIINRISHYYHLDTRKQP